MDMIHTHKIRTKIVWWESSPRLNARFCHYSCKSWV